MDQDAIEAELRFLYSEGMRLQQQQAASGSGQQAAQAFLSLLRHRVFRDINRRQHSALEQSDRRGSTGDDGDDGEEEEEGRAWSSRLSRGLLQLHVLSLRSLSVLYEKQDEDEVAMRCLALAVSSAGSSPSLADTVLSMRLSLSRCALRLRLLPIARCELEAVLAQRADDWEAIDLLTDALLCIGDQQALLQLTRHALRLDAGFVKGLLVYSLLQPDITAETAAPASSALPCRLLQHCHRTLQLIPQADLRRVTAHLQSLSSPSHFPPPPTPHRACLMRDIRLRRSDPLASLASILLSLYVEVRSQQHGCGEGDALTASQPRCLTVQDLLRWLRAKQARGSTSELPGREEGATSAAQTAAAAASLLTPVILRLDEQLSPSPAGDSDVLVLSAEDDEAAPGGGAAMSGFMLSACAFLSAHCSSADSNSGVVDLIRRFLCWLRREDVEEAVSGVELCDLVLAALSASVQDDDDDVDELLFMAEVLLDDVSTSPAAAASEPVEHSALFSAATASSAAQLASLMARLQLLSVCYPERFVPWHSVRLFFLQAQLHVLRRYSLQALQCLLDCQTALTFAASSSSISALLVPHSRRHPRIDELVLSRAIARVEQRRNRRRSKRKRW